MPKPAMFLSAAAAALFFPLAMFPGEGASRFTSIDGQKVHYVSYGKGVEADVYIHGWTCDLTFWQGQAPVYEGRRSLLIDLPGHGDSGKPEVSYTMALFARAVDAVLKAEKVRRSTLIGHSMGAAVTVQYLRLNPGKVAGVAIVDGFIPAPPKDDAERQRSKAQSEGMQKALRGPEYMAFAKRFVDSMLTPRLDAATQDKVRTVMLGTPQFVMASAMEGMGAMTPMGESFPQVPAVAMMVKRPNSAQYRDFLSQHFRLVDFHDFEGAGHFLMMEEPEKFNGQLRAFLARK